MTKIIAFFTLLACFLCLSCSLSPPQSDIEMIQKLTETASRLETEYRQVQEELRTTRNENESLTLMVSSSRQQSSWLKGLLIVVGFGALVAGAGLGSKAKESSQLWKGEKLGHQTETAPTASTTH